MKTIHGSKTKNDRLDSYKIAASLRGGNLPYAYVYPRPMRATRDHEGSQVPALPLSRARGQLTGIFGSTSQLFEWDGTRGQNSF